MASLGSDPRALLSAAAAKAAPVARGGKSRRNGSPKALAATGHGFLLRSRAKAQAVLIGAAQDHAGRIFATALHPGKIRRLADVPPRLWLRSGGPPRRACAHLRNCPGGDVNDNMVMAAFRGHGKNRGTRSHRPGSRALIGAADTIVKPSSRLHGGRWHRLRFCCFSDASGSFFDVVLTLFPLLLAGPRYAGA